MVARTMMSCCVAASVSNGAPVPTTSLSPTMAKRPPASSTSEKVCVSFRSGFVAPSAAISVPGSAVSRISAAAPAATGAVFGASVMSVGTMRDGEGAAVPEVGRVVAVVRHRVDVIEARVERQRAEIEREAAVGVDGGGAECISIEARVVGIGEEGHVRARIGTGEADVRSARSWRRGRGRRRRP